MALTEEKHNNPRLRDKKGIPVDDVCKIKVT